MHPAQASTFWTVLIACIGGVVVVLGLLFETLADKKSFADIKSFRRWHTLKGWGEWLVIAGVAIEVIVAGFTAIDEWETKQVATKNDPQKRPLFALSAYAYVVVRPLEPCNDLQDTNIPSQLWAENCALFPLRVVAGKGNGDPVWLRLGRASQLGTRQGGEEASMNSDTVVKSIALYGKEKLLRFDAYFGTDTGENALPMSNRNLFNPLLTPEHLNALTLSLPLRCEIVEGIVQLNIDNGIIQRFFQIPKQETFGNSAGTVATNGTFVALDWSPEVRADFAKSESIRLKKSADEAVFAKTGADLEAKANSDAKKDRIISKEQRKLFTNLLSGYPRTPIKVFVNAGDAETIAYAKNIRLLLDDAGYSGTNSNVITNDLWFYSGTNVVRWEPTPHTLIFMACPEKQFGFSVPVHTRFDSIKPVISSGLTNDPAGYALGSLECVRWGFSGIGLTGFYVPNTNILNYGEAGIFVPPRGKESATNPAP